MAFTPEVVRVDVRLVGNVTGKVYAESSVSIITEQKAREIYLGGCFLSIPFYPTEGEDFPELDPTDTKLELEYRTNSKNTRFGRDPEGNYIGHVEVSLLELPNAVVEIPSGDVT